MKKLVLTLSLAVSASAYSVNHQEFEYRPDFVQIKQNEISDEHISQASLGHLDALIEAHYISFNQKGLSILEGNNGKFHKLHGKQFSGNEISMKLPGVKQPVLLYVENVQHLIEGEDVVTYTGYTSKDTNNFFTLSVSDNGVMGKINYGKYIYVITPLQDSSNKHSIAKLDKSLIVQDYEDDVLDYKYKEQSSNSVQKSGGGSGRVDILFYYGSDVYWPHLYVSTIISEMNAALSRSGVSSNNRVYSVGYLPTGTTFPGDCKNQIVDKMSYRQAEFSTIDQEMITYGADIAFVIVGDNSASGCFPGFPGRVGGVAATYNSSLYPFVVTAQSYTLGDLTALHEIGHIIGGHHAIDNFYINGTPNWARGKIVFDNQNPDNSWQTIMGSYGTWQDNCVFSGPYTSPCERIDYFSNPSISYNGVPTGDSSRNMKNWLNSNMTAVSNWRGAPVPPPSSPNPISAQSAQCFGFNTVNWTAKSGATEYKLYKSTSSSFTSPVMLYSGANTFTGVNVNAGTWYLRAKACNASGCSAYSSQVTASRIGSCL